MSDQEVNIEFGTLILVIYLNKYYEKKTIFEIYYSNKNKN